MSWGPWITDSVPHIGDYVQIYCHNQEFEHEKHTFEGIVASISEDLQLKLVGQNELSCWVAEKWRKRRLPEHQSQRARELEELL